MLETSNNKSYRDMRGYYIYTMYSKTVTLFILFTTGKAFCFAAYKHFVLYHIIIF